MQVASVAQIAPRVPDESREERSARTNRTTTGPLRGRAAPHPRRGSYIHGTHLPLVAPAGMFSPRSPLSGKRIFGARALAVVADAIQLGLLPLFVQGAASPLNDALDVAVGAALVALVG